MACRVSLQTFLGVSLCICIIVGRPLCGEVVSDNFNDNALSRSLWSPLSVDSSGSAVEVNQRLEVTGQGSLGNFLSGVRLRGTVAGNFDIQVAFTLLTDIDSLPMSREPGVGLAWDLDWPLFIIRTGGDGVGAVGYDVGDGEASVPYSGRSGRLRITRNGALYSAYYWNGGDWQLMHSTAGSSTGPVQIFVGIAGNGPISLSAAFDDFLVQADQINLEVLAPSTVALPHLAVGDIWTTELIVANTGDQSRRFSISFYDDNGGPLALPITGVGNVSVLSASVPAHGTAYYEAADRAGPLRSSWGIVTTESSSVGVQAIFRSRTGAGMHYEAAVASTAGGSGFVMPFDATTFAETGAPFYTGFAVVNLDSTADAIVTCTARDGGGTLIPNGVSLPPVPPHGHYANYLFPNLTGNRGTLDCTSNTTVAALGLRFIGTDAFTSLSVYPK